MNELNLIIETKDEYGYCEINLTLQIQTDSSYYIEESKMYITDLDKLNDKNYLNNILMNSRMLSKNEEPTGRYEITEV